MSATSTEAPPRADSEGLALTASKAENLVRDWLRRLSGGAVAEELAAHLANGMRLELPERIVRGVEEFTQWCRDGAHHLLTGLPLGGGVLEVTLTSPVHAQVVVTSPSPEAGHPSQEWWVVLCDGVPRIRVITVTGLHPEPLLASATTALV